MFHELIVMEFLRKLVHILVFITVHVCRHVCLVHVVAVSVWQYKLVSIRLFHRTFTGRVLNTYEHHNLYILARTNVCR